MTRRPYRVLLTALAVTMAAAMGAAAQDDPVEREQAVGLDPRAITAAEALVEAMDLEALTRATTESMLENMLAQNPVLADYRSVFLNFFDEYLRWEEVKDDYVRVYAEVYTPEELRELTSFYQTPLGARLLETTPLVSARAARIGEEAIEPHLAELQRRLSEAMEASMGSPEQ